MTVTGGYFGNSWITDDTTILTPSGGMMGLDLDFFVKGDSVLRVIGSGFDTPRGDVVPTAGTLSGLLSDSNPFTRDFTRAASAVITLVPEPSTGLLLGAALVGAGLVGAAATRSRYPRSASSSRVNGPQKSGRDA